MRVTTLSLAALLSSGLAGGFSVAAALPPGFTQTELSPGWTEIAGITPLGDGRALAWERAGRVWMMSPEGERIQPPLIDLTDEVGGWRDHGLLGVVPHPAFLENGWFYLLYVVDRHHLLYAGTPQYNPGVDDYYSASIGRITRYTAEADTKFTSVDPASRLVLLGATKETGIPVVHQSHGVGTLLFGEDGTLLVSVGDNASYESVDLGGQVSGGYVAQALADGILRPEENVGAFRSQLVDSFCGKVLRLDPLTGEGLPSNPFFDPSEPRAPRSLVWCLGLRNPFRMMIEPETGSHDPADGDPGTLYIGDVGWVLYEELNRAPGGGLNFGWPVFEGLQYHDAYGKADVLNLDAPNPLEGPTCNEDFFRFRTLIRQESQVLSTAWLNPCGMLQAESATKSGAVTTSLFGGYTGSGYAAFNAGAGSWLDFNVSVPSGGDRVVAVRYSNGSGAKLFKLRVDGVVVADSIAAPSTGTGSEWRVLSVTVPMSAGAHTLRLETASPSGLNIDGIAVHAPGDAPLIDPALTFMHARPLADWHHTTGVARVPTFIAGGAGQAAIGGPTSTVSGQTFGGQCAIGGPVLDHHTFESWPEEWHDQVLFGDFSSAWLRSFTLDPFGKVTGVSVFEGGFGNVVSLVANPHDASIWAIRWPGDLFRIAYEPGGNQPPVIAVSTSQPWGPSPLAVTFDASGSSDPEGTPLTFDWDFGDGVTASGASVAHVFTAPSSAPATFFVTLTVTDAGRATKTKTIVVSANNSPPVVALTSVYDGQLYPLDGKSILPLLASISDAEHGPEQLSCEWIAILHHNTHEHPEPSDPNCESSIVISPLGCGVETYWFEAQLRVTDAGGLSAFVNANLYPDCDGLLACAGDFDLSGVVDGADLAELLGGWNSPATWIDLDGDGTVGGGDLGILLGAWGVCR